MEFVLVRGVILVLLATGIGLLADAAAEGDGLTAIDRPVWAWLINHRTATPIAVAKIITAVGSTVAMGVVAVVAVLLLAIRPATRGEAVLVAAVTAGGGLIVSVAKPIVGRVRPPEEFRLVTETNQSFPSGHAVASIAVLGVLAVVLTSRVSTRSWRAVIRVALAVFVALIGISRLYLGVHWPTDIAGGWIAGLAWLLLCLTIRTIWRTYPVLTRVRQRFNLQHPPGGPNPLPATMPHERQFNHDDH